MPYEAPRSAFRILERIPHFSPSAPSMPSPEIRRTVGTPMGMLAPPGSTGNPPTTFGRNGFAIGFEDAAKAWSYEDVAATLGLQSEKHYPDALLEMKDGSVVTIPIGTRSEGKAWDAVTVLNFLSVVIRGCGKS